MYSNSKTNLVGHIGEDIVFNYLANELGYDVRHYGDSNNSHKIDFIINDGTMTYLADVKTKRRREKYEDTGIDSKDNNSYRKLAIKEKMDVYIFFVDYFEKSVYGNYLDNLNEFDGMYPRDNGKITYFSLKNMEHILNLTDDDVALLRQYDN